MFPAKADDESDEDETTQRTKAAEADEEEISWAIFTTSRDVPFEQVQGLV